MAGIAAPPTVTDVHTATAVIDIHQHLWPEELLSALSRRRGLPRLRRVDGGWVIQLAGEPDATVDLADHDPDRRAPLARSDGVDRVIVAPSSPIGIEALQPAESEPLIRAYHDGVRALPHPFAGWATASLHDPDADALGERLDAGFVGLCLPGRSARQSPWARPALDPLRPARAARRAAVRPSGPCAMGAAASHARLPAAELVVTAHHLRQRDACGLAPLAGRRPQAPPGAAGLLRTARGARPAPRGAPDAPGRIGRRRGRTALL